MFYGTYKLMMDRYRFTSPRQQNAAKAGGLVTFIARRQLRQDLLAMPDRRLDDLGFSRDLLNLGVKAWPWRTDATQGVVESISLDTTTPLANGRTHIVCEPLPTMASQRQAA